MALAPATHFGNANATLPHNMSQRTFATHGQHILGGIDSFANRMGVEAFQNFWNLLRLSNLRLKLNPDDILQHIFYTDDEGKDVPLRPAPIGFHPLQDEETLLLMRSYYRWYIKECNRVLISIHKSEYKNNTQLAVEQDQTLFRAQFLPSAPQLAALLPNSPNLEPESLDKAATTLYRVVRKIDYAGKEVGFHFFKALW